MEHHLRPTQMAQPDALPTPRAIFRYQRDLGDAAIDTLFLSLADYLAARGPRLELARWRWHVTIIAKALRAHESEEMVARPRRLVTGHDLMRELDMSPGPLLGRVMRAVEEGVGSKEVTTRWGALALVRRLARELGVSPASP